LSALVELPVPQLRADLDGAHEHLAVSRCSLPLGVTDLNAMLLPFESGLDAERGVGLIGTWRARSRDRGATGRRTRPQVWILNQPTTARSL
jgi:hypothetical protein